MTTNSSHFLPNISKHLIETIYSTEEFKAKYKLAKAVMDYTNAIKCNQSAKIVKQLRKKIDRLCKQIAHLRKNTDNVLQDVLRRGYKQSSIETAQTRKAEGSF